MTHPESAQVATVVSANVAGIRIHHPSDRSCTVIVPHPGDSRTGRAPKDYHIRLDANGDCIVSDTVWRRLLEAKASGLSPHAFIVLNEVKDPPTIVVRRDGKRKAPNQRAVRQMPDGNTVEAQMWSAMQELAPKGVKPRITTKQVGMAPPITVPKGFLSKPHKKGTT